MLEPLVVLALKTAMRLGELLSLEWEHINVTTRIAYLPTTKNGEARSVPLSPTAIDTISRVPRNIHSPRLFWAWQRSERALPAPPHQRLGEDRDRRRSRD